MPHPPRPENDQTLTFTVVADLLELDQLLHHVVGDGLEAAADRYSTLEGRDEAARVLRGLSVTAAFAHDVALPTPDRVSGPAAVLWHVIVNDRLAHLDSLGRAVTCNSLPRPEVRSTLRELGSVPIAGIDLTGVHVAEVVTGDTAVSCVDRIVGEYERIGRWSQADRLRGAVDRWIADGSPLALVVTAGPAPILKDLGPAAAVREVR